MAEDVKGNAKTGYFNKSGERVIWPQYAVQTDQEYKEVVDAHKSGKPLDEKRSREIQGNIDRREKGRVATEKHRVLYKKFRSRGMVKDTPKKAPAKHGPSKAEF